MNLIVLITLLVLAANHSSGQYVFMPFECASAYQNALLNAINSYRANHGVPPLTKVNALTAAATSWAVSLAPKGTLTPSGNVFGYGESVYAGVSSMPFDIRTISMCARYGTDAAIRWYNQVNLYNFATNSCMRTGGCNDFTQMVWRGTTGIGFGLAVSGSGLSILGGRYFLVATVLYQSKGNIAGLYASNVFPLGTPVTAPPTTIRTTTTTTTTAAPRKCQIIPSSCQLAFQNRLLQLINQKRANHGSPPIVFHDNPTWTNRTASWACDEVKNTNLAKNPALLPDQQLFFSDNYINAQTLSDSFCSSLADNAINRWYFRAWYMDYTTGKSWCKVNTDLSEFTALVWKSATKFSCSLQISSVREKDFAFWHVVHCDIDVDANINKPEFVLANVGRPIPVTISPECHNAFHQSAINAHNVYRVKHQVPPAVAFTNSTWSQITKDYATSLSFNRSTQHNPLLKTYGFGENIYGFFSSVNPNMADLAFCAKQGKDAVDAWYSEIKSYNFATGLSTDGGVIGHFTQVVWKTSTNVGCGLAVQSVKDSKGLYWVLVVCNYSPPGNYAGAYTSNVFPAV